MNLWNLARTLGTIGAMATQSRTYGSFRAIRAADREWTRARHGNDAWFCSKNMEFFNTHVLPGVYGRRFFLTKDSTRTDGDTFCHIRWVDSRGRIDTVGPTMTWDYPAALTAVQALSKAVEKLEAGK